MGRHPLFEGKSRSAPFVISVWTTASCPLKAAIHNAEAPSFSLAKWIAAPFLISNAANFS